jgi:hypothetical protein
MGKRSGRFSNRRSSSTCTTWFRQNLIRDDLMDAFEQSVARNRDLLQRLAK